MNLLTCFIERSRTMAKKTTSKSVSDTFGVEKNCKRVVKYGYEDPDNANAISNVYISKEALEKLGNPKEVTVTIKPA
jgi:hypothetical protein